MSSSTRAARAALAVAGLFAASCASPAAEPIVRAYLFEKGEYQAVYGPDGRLLRLLQDSDGDRVANVVIVYAADGSRRVEIDSDGDGALDRWEIYDGRVRLARVGSARGGSGVAELWETLDPSGRVIAREFMSADGQHVARRETFESAGLSAVAFDTDGDGRMDRWQSWRASRLQREDLDTNADGAPDRRLLFESGRPPRLVRLAR